MTSFTDVVSHSLSLDRRRAVERLFDPRSVAIVGASNHQSKWGYRLAASALRGTNRRAVYLVNRNGGEILGREVHTSLTNLPEVPELVVVAVPAGQFGTVVEQAIAAGTRAVVGITAGLGEKGGAAALREHRQAQEWRQRGLTLVGPNCAGLGDSGSALSLAYTPQPPGTIGLVSQSGNLIVEFARLLEPRELGFSRYVSVGNQADLVVADFLENLADHPGTEAIACYVEDFSDGRRFMSAARAATAAGKPVAVLSVGRSGAGSRTAHSHTGAMASDHRVVSAACRAAGAELVRTPGELADLLEAWRARARPRTGRVGVLGDGGGHCAIAADVLVDRGLVVEELSAAGRARLEQLLPPTASAANPIDLAGAAEGDLEVYGRLLAVLGDLPELDALLLTGYFGAYSLLGSEQRAQEQQVAHQIARAATAWSRPLVVHSINPASPAIGVLRAAGIPVYERIESAARALSALTGVDVPRPASPREPARPLDARGFGYFGAREFVARADISLVAASTVADAPAAIAAAREIGFPVVLKALGAAHKSDNGAVALGIEDEADLERAFARVGRRTGATEYSVEQMASVTGAVEMIVGVRRDPRFGWLVMVGLGGVYAEVFDDVAVSLLPTSVGELAQRVLELRCAPLLTGARGRPADDLRALCRAAVALGAIAATHDDLDEVEINPLLVRPNGVLALDARVITSSQADAGGRFISERGIVKEVGDDHAGESDRGAAV
ncbi:MAG: acetate--CoA ligase family protein [Solirubrobacteraceae bacterium]